MQQALIVVFVRDFLTLYINKIEILLFVLISFTKIMFLPAKVITAVVLLVFSRRDIQTTFVVIGTLRVNPPYIYGLVHRV